MTITKTEKEYLTLKELSLKLNIPVRTIENWNINKLVHGTIKVGRQYRYNIATIDKAIINGQLLKQ